jgi:hypothetical protein
MKKLAAYTAILSNTFAIKKVISEQLFGAKYVVVVSMYWLFVHWNNQSNAGQLVQADPAVDLH